MASSSSSSASSSSSSSSANNKRRRTETKEKEGNDNEEDANEDAQSKTMDAESPTRYHTVELRVSIENLSLQWLMDNPRYADLRVVLHRTGRELRVCSGLLAALSPVFKAMFEHKMRENLTAELHINKPVSNGLNHETDTDLNAKVSIEEVGDDENAFAAMIELLFKGKVTLRIGPIPSEMSLEDPPKFITEDQSAVCEIYESLDEFVSSEYDPTMMRCYSSIWSILELAEKYDICILRDTIVKTIGAWLKAYNVVVAAEWVCRSLAMSVPPPPSMTITIGKREMVVNFNDFAEHVIASRPVKHFWILNNLPPELFQRILQRDDLAVAHERQVLRLIERYISLKEFKTNEEMKAANDKLICECLRVIHLGYRVLNDLLNKSTTYLTHLYEKIVMTLMKDCPNQKRRKSYKDGIFLHARANRIPSLPPVTQAAQIPNGFKVMRISGHHPSRPNRNATPAGLPPGMPQNRNESVLDYSGCLTVTSKISLWLEGVSIYRKRGTLPENHNNVTTPPTGTFRLEFADSGDVGESFFVEASIDTNNEELPDIYAIQLPTPVRIGPDQGALRIGVAFKARPTDLQWQCYVLVDNFHVGNYMIAGVRQEYLSRSDLPYLQNVVQCSAKVKESGIAGLSVWIPSFDWEWANFGV